MQFVELSGGLDGGSNPPAFQCAEKERMEKEMVEEGSNDSSAVGKFSQGLNPCNNVMLSLSKFSLFFLLFLTNWHNQELWWFSYFRRC